MVQLENSLRTFFQEVFQAKVVRLSMKADAGLTFMPSITHGISPIPIQGTPSYCIDVEVIESDSKLMKTEYPAHSIHSAMKDGFITKALNGSGVVTSMSTNMSYRGGFRTTICFVTHDLHEFVHKLENFGWKAFSNHFDKEVEDTLKD